FFHQMFNRPPLDIGVEITHIDHFLCIFSEIFFPFSYFCKKSILFHQMFNRRPLDIGVKIIPIL
ncbi:hypothetical protein, partial [Okeania sp. SIO2B3]|uniref:hypothetical protein n=1 Tax=Okeania sp. SIO2B3 TaxID=2607784 RepID=UPI0025DAF023